MHCLAEIIASPLAIHHVLVDFASGDVRVTGQRDVKESLIVSQIEIALPTIVENVDFAVFVRRECPGVCAIKKRGKSCEWRVFATRNSVGDPLSLTRQS